MSAATPVPLAKAYRLLNHGPTVLVTSAAGDSRNVMAAAWNMALDFDPPKVCVVIDRTTFTRELVDRSGEFGLCVPTRAQARMTRAVGDSSGRTVDKFAQHALGTWMGTHIRAPLIDGCLAWLECKVVPEPHNQERYDLYIGQVHAAWADPAVFAEGRWLSGRSVSRSIHYIAGGAFFETGERFDVDDQ